MTAIVNELGIIDLLITFTQNETQDVHETMENFLVTQK